MMERSISIDNCRLNLSTDNNVNRSTIRLTLENVSTIKVDFLHFAFEDSTIEPAQKALADGNLSVFETYETEYNLIHRPVFSWDQDEAKTVEPGHNLTLTLGCFGKVGWYVNLIGRPQYAFPDFLLQQQWNDPHLLLLRRRSRSPGFRSILCPTSFIPIDGHGLPHARMQRDGSLAISILPSDSAAN